MITTKNIFGSITDYNNVVMAYDRARSCKRYRLEFLQLERDRYLNLEILRDSVINKTYRMGDYQYFVVFEPKARDIMKLPAEDRIVQHMWDNVVVPCIDPRLYYHSYACRPGKGTHLASNTLSHWIYGECILKRKNRLWALKGDIHSYFKTVNHEILKRHFRRFIGDPEVLRLTDVFIDNNGLLQDGVGIPVGNLSSQLFANVYGDILDRYVKNVLGCDLYIRYMDDFVILSDDYMYLEWLMENISSFVMKEMAMTLNPKSNIVFVPNGLNFIGFVHYPDYTVPRKEKRRDLLKFVDSYMQGYISKEDFDRSFVSRLGHIQHCDSYQFINGVMSDILDFNADLENPEYHEICKED